MGLLCTLCVGRGGGSTEWEVTERVPEPKIPWPSLRSCIDPYPFSFPSLTCFNLPVHSCVSLNPIHPVLIKLYCDVLSKIRACVHVVGEWGGQGEGGSEEGKERWGGQGEVRRARRGEEGKERWGSEEGRSYYYLVPFHYIPNVPETSCRTDMTLLFCFFLGPGFSQLG